MAQDTDSAAVEDEWEAALEEQNAGSGEEKLAEGWNDALEDDDDDANKAERVLNQTEIDNLLGFDKAEQAGGERSGIEALVNSSLVSYERLPMLEIVFDRLVRLSTTTLRNFTSDNVEVSIDSMTSVRYADYVNSIPLPAILAVFRAREWENFGLVTVESNLIYSIIDVLLGGGRGGSLIRVEGRPFTTIESNLVRQMIELLLEDAQRAFAPLTQINFDLERLETNPRFANISRPANAAMLVQLRIDMEDRGGNVEFLIPYSTIEPIRDLLLQAFMGEKFGRDLNWESHLASEVFQSELQLNAVLADEMIALREVLDLQVGQTIVFNRGPQQPVQLTCSGIPVTRGIMGRKGDHISLKISQGLNPQKMTLAAYERAAQAGSEK